MKKYTKKDMLGFSEWVRNGITNLEYSKIKNNEELLDRWLSIKPDDTLSLNDFINKVSEIEKTTGLKLADDNEKQLILGQIHEKGISLFSCEEIKEDLKQKKIHLSRKTLYGAFEALEKMKVIYTSTLFEKGLYKLNK